MPFVQPIFMASISTELLSYCIISISSYMYLTKSHTQSTKMYASPMALHGKATIHLVPLDIFKIGNEHEHLEKRLTTIITS